MKNKLDKIYKSSKKFKISDKSKIVIMSDCHRGAGNNEDNFVKNQNIFKSALLYYYNKGFTYIELGDGDEMIEVKKYQDIIEEHIDTFKQMKKFHDTGKLYMIYGNHDLPKKSNTILEKYFYKYYNKSTKQNENLLKNLNVYESLILNYKENKIFLVHGHQASFFNSTLWRTSRFLIRYVWKNIEKFGINDPTSAAKNYQVTKRIEKKLKNWSIQNNTILITGHTHRPVFPNIGQSLYFNDGSCIHPNGITCIEIEKGKITLVKWDYKIKNKEFLTVGRTVIEGKEPIKNFFKKDKNKLKTS